MNKKIGGLMMAVLAGALICGMSAVQNKRETKMNLTNPFGVLEFLHWNHEWNHYKYSNYKELDKAVSLMKQAGVGWVRMDFLWSDIEPHEGAFDFNKYDYLVDLLYKNHIQLLGILDYSTDWASACGKWNCPPKDSATFLNFVKKLAGRYKDKVKYWELWNEPDSYIYWEPQDGLVSYCALLKEVYGALKEIDPECKVLNGGLANGLASINRLYDNGAKDYFDILNIHIFESPLDAMGIKRVIAYPKLAHKLMVRKGDGDKKIWVTEIGSPGVPKGQKVKNWWAGPNPNEQEQASWVRMVYGELLKNPAVEKIFWAFFRDTKEHWDNGTDYFGIVRWDFSRKPSFEAYRESYLEWEKTQPVAEAGGSGDQRPLR